MVRFGMGMSRSRRPTIFFMMALEWRFGKLKITILIKMEIFLSKVFTFILRYVQLLKLHLED